MASRQDETLIWVPLVVVFVIAFVAVKSIANTLNLHWQPALECLVGWIVVAGATALSFTHGDAFSFTRLKNVWPALVAAFWISWWPALDDWDIISSFPALSIDQAESVLRGGAWWDSNWVKYIPILILAGWTLRNINQDPY